jgi:predicted lysophospholipase L1 biosynthesis ABC-type transport system permease subunit
MIEKLRFYTRHSMNDLRVNGQRTLFVLLCIAAGVAAIVSLQTLGVMIEDTLTGSLQEANRGDMRASLFFEFNHSEEEEEGEHGPGRREQETENALFDQGVEEGVLVESNAFGENYISAYGIDTIRAWFDEHYPGTEITYQQVLNSFSSGISISVPDRET